MSRKKKAPPKRLSHYDRAARRAEIAESVRAALKNSDGSDPHLMSRQAARYGVTLTTVYAACREHGVALERAGGPTRTLSIVADLERTDDSFVAVAARHKVSAQWVRQLFRDCLEAGIAVRPRSRTRAARP